MQRRKIIVNNDTYETLDAVRKSFRNEVSDDDILMAAFSALAEKMYNKAKKSREEVVE
jgi:hypothetical protein